MWWKLLRLDLTIPKHSFIGWLIINNKLFAEDRMGQVGVLR